MLEKFDYEKEKMATVAAKPIHSNLSYSISELLVPNGMRSKISAYFVEPTSFGPFPAVLYLHPATKNKDYFLDDARKLAKNGIASLLVEAAIVRPEWSRSNCLKDPDLERGLYRQSILDLRYSIDFLESRTNILGEVLGFVGQNFGAVLGAILAAHDKRLRALVFTGGVPSLAQFWERSLIPIAVAKRAAATNEELRTFIENTQEFAAIHHVRKLAPTPVFFQFAKNDPWISRSAGFQLYEAASSPKRMRFYDTDHDFQLVEVKRDYMQWLGEKLAKRNYANV